MFRHIRQTPVLSNCSIVLSFSPSLSLFARVLSLRTPSWTDSQSHCSHVPLVLRCAIWWTFTPVAPIYWWPIPYHLCTINASLTISHLNSLNADPLAPGPTSPHRLVNHLASSAFVTSPRTSA